MILFHAKSTQRCRDACYVLRPVQSNPCLRIVARRTFGTRCPRSRRRSLSTRPIRSRHRSQPHRGVRDLWCSQDILLNVARMLMGLILLNVARMLMGLTFWDCLCTMYNKLYDFSCNIPLGKPESCCPRPAQNSRPHRTAAHRTSVPRCRRFLNKRPRHSTSR